MSTGVRVGRERRVRHISRPSVRSPAERGPSVGQVYGLVSTGTMSLNTPRQVNTPSVVGIQGPSKRTMRSEAHRLPRLRSPHRTP